MYFNVDLRFESDVILYMSQAETGEGTPVEEFESDVILYMSQA